MDELISVIIPVYNVEQYLNRCIDSIIGQTYQNIEIILIDDGSTDSSGKICDEYIGKDKRIQVIHKTNGGLSDARNYGIEQAVGQYFCFIDSDDYITEETIEIMYKSLSENDCDISVCNMIRFFDDENTQHFYKPTNDVKILYGEQRFETLKQPSVCNKLFKAELFDNLRFPKEKYYEDTYIYHVLAYRAKNIVLTGHDGYWYYSRRDSILGQPIYTNRYFDFIEAVWLRARFLAEAKVEYYAREACLSLYVAYSNAKKNIAHTDINQRLFEKSKEQFLFAYDYLMSDESIGIKQRLRLVLLKYCPRIHSAIY